MSVIIHHGSSFLVSAADGEIAPGGDGGFYVHDTRFLSCWQLRLDGKPLVELSASTPQHQEALHYLTNPELQNGKRATVGVRLRRVVAGGLHADLELENFGDGAIATTLELRLGVDFEYVLTVKKQALAGELPRERPRVRAELQPDGRTLKLWLDGGEVPRSATVAFSERPDFLDASGARWAVALEKRGRFHLCVDLAVQLGDRHIVPEETCRRAPREEAAAERAGSRRKQVRALAPALETDHPVLARAYAQAIADMAELRIKAEGDGDATAGPAGAGAIAAGIPWYMDLFGRDSLIASIESMLQDPQLARGTLLALAGLQGTKRDEKTEEAPGKILHEYRSGPVPPIARKQIPGYPYYGSIDATPWFLVALSEHARVTGDLSLARQLWPNARAALEWLDKWGDRDGDGFLEYQRDSEEGLQNQCWKDSEDSMRFRDGRLAKAPIAAVEVQGYAFDALARMAELALKLGDDSLSRELDRRAAKLRSQISSAYWMEERGTFALALDGHKRQVDSLTSNPGHLLFSGVPTAEQARRVAATLLGGELFSGFGVRTMGAREGGFNPMSYHNGSVWPHDNALALWGLVRYGLAEEAGLLAQGLLAALSHFEKNQPPELFCGFDKGESATPVHYVQANKPQAWASGAVLLLVRSILGLSVDALEKKVSVRPLAIPGLQEISLRGVPAGASRFDVHIDYQRKPSVRVEGLPPGFTLDAPGSLREP